MLRSIYPASARATFVLFHAELLLVLFHRMVPSHSSSSSSSSSSKQQPNLPTTVRVGEPFSRLVAMILDWLLYDSTHLLVPTNKDNNNNVNNNNDDNGDVDGVLEATLPIPKPTSTSSPQKQEDESKNGITASTDRLHHHQAVPYMLSCNCAIAEELFTKIVSNRKIVSSSSSSPHKNMYMDSHTFIPNFALQSCRACLEAGVQYVKIAPEHQEKLLQLVVQQSKAVAHFVELSSTPSVPFGDDFIHEKPQIILMHALTSRLKCLDSQLMSLEAKMSTKDKELLFAGAANHPTTASLNDEEKAKITEKKLQKAIYVRDQAVLKVRSLIHKIQEDFGQYSAENISKNKASAGSPSTTPENSPSNSTAANNALVGAEIAATATTTAANNNNNNQINSGRYNLFLGYFRSRNEARVSMLSDLGLQSVLISTFGDINEPFAKVLKVAAAAVAGDAVATQTSSTSNLDEVFNKCYGQEINFEDIFFAMGRTCNNVTQSNNNSKNVVPVLTMVPPHFADAVKILGILVMIKERTTTTSADGSNNKNTIPSEIIITLENWKNFLTSDWISLRPIAIMLSQKINSAPTSNGNANCSPQQPRTGASSSSPSSPSSQQNSVPRSGDYLLALMDQQN